MRTIFFFLAALVVLPPLTRAQDDELINRKAFEGALLLGSSITQVDGDTYNGYHKAGVHVGARVYWHFFSFLGMSMEMVYSQKGARGGNVKESIYLGTYIDKYFLNLDYIEVPFLLHYDRRILDYEVGISYCRLLKANEWAEADVPVRIYPDINVFNKDDIEGLAGITGRINKHWSGGIRYQYSLRPIRNWDRVPDRYARYGVNQYNKVVILRVIYTL